MCTIGLKSESLVTSRGPSCASPLLPSLRDAGDEGFNPQLSGQEGGGLRAGETRPTQRPQEPRLYPSIISSHEQHDVHTQWNTTAAEFSL